MFGSGRGALSVWHSLTKSVLDVLHYADHNLKKRFSDDRLRKWFGQWNECKLKFAMDEPFLCCRMHVHKLALVRKHHPQILIGDIETYPSIPLADHTDSLKPYCFQFLITLS